MTTETGVRTATINGVSLKYTDTSSDKPAIVFVHGWTCNRNDWRHQIKEFAGSHRVVALDQRGHGESEKPDQDYTIDGFAEDLAAFIAEIGLERPVIVGHSMGGAVTHNLIRRQPEVARAMVLVDSNIMPPPERVSQTLASALQGMETPSYREITRGLIEDMFNVRSDAAMKQELTAGMIETPQRVIRTALASLFDETKMYEGPMPVPTLFLRAATMPNSANEIKGRFPNIELTEIDGAHFLQLEHPAEVNEAIRGFIKRLTEVSA